MYGPTAVDLRRHEVPGFGAGALAFGAIAVSIGNVAGAAIDDFYFTALAVPAPASVCMMLVGSGALDALGARGRRRRAT